MAVMNQSRVGKDRRLVSGSLFVGLPMLPLVAVMTLLVLRWWY
jgi:hypothetical protein